METCFNYSSDKAYFSSDERKWINKIHRLKEQHPDKVTILREPQSNNGCIYATLPSETLKIQFKREYTEEQKQAAAARLASYKKSE